MTTAVVRIWHGDDGWGIIDSPETPGGCWAHFSSIEVDGYKALPAGQEVVLQWEIANQDGFGFRAVRVRPAT